MKNHTRTYRSQSMLLKCSFVLVLLGILGGLAHLSFGQDTNASLSGTVTDPTGAVIPGANLTLTNIATGFKVNFVSDSSGTYSFHDLTPGKYSLVCSAKGFKSTSQTGIELAINQAGRIDVHLPLGNADETVTVIGDASLINYENPTLQGGISPSTLQQFPLTISGAPRSSVAIAILMPGVTDGGGGFAFNSRINGGLVTGDEALVDGATTTEGFMNQSGMTALYTDFGMSPDITSEVKILTANYDAQYGNTTSGQLVISTRSGSERFHGAAYEYIRNDAMNAAQYGASFRTPDKENDYGANIGGPIWLPKFHGPNSFIKGYFYFNWEGFKDHGSASTATLSIASLNDRNGNFSGAGSQLYYPNDPAKYGTDAGTPIAYGGVANQINPIYEDSIAKAWMAALPTPTNSNELNNYVVPHAGQGSLTNSENVYFWRTDFNVGSKDHLYYTYWWQYSGINTNSNLPQAVSTAQPASPENAPIQRFNWEHNFSSLMTNHFTYGYLNRNEGYYSLNSGASLPAVPGVANTAYLPEFTFGSGYSQLGNSEGPKGTTKTTRGTNAINDVLTRVISRHTLTAGFEWRLAGTTIRNETNQGGTFTFNPDTTGNTSCGSSSCPGDAMASFYLGAVSSASIEYYNVYSTYPRQTEWAWHIGDSWRFSPKLTLNYSVRWDYITPFREKYDHLSFFDPAGLNPGAVTTSGTELPGRLAFAGNSYGSASYGAPYPEIPFKKAFSPRVGFAYSLNSGTVIRAGYGIYFGQAFCPGWGGCMSLDGFNKALSLNETTTSNSTMLPALELSNGISSSSVGQTENISSSFDNGTTPSIYRPFDADRRPYSSQWNVTIERQLPQNFFASLSYVGTKGTHLPSTLSPLNVLNPDNPSITNLSASTLATSYTDSNGPAAFAAAGVTIPYPDWPTQMTGCSPTVAQALLPFPQYCGTLQGQNEEHATSIYNSFQGRIERHMQNGLYLLGSLTVQKLYTDASDTVQSNQDIGNGHPGNNGAFSPYKEFPRAWSIAQDNVPVTVSVAAVYELPFGENKPFLNASGAARTLSSGWQVSPVFRYEWGTPFSFYSSNCPTSTEVPEFRESCIPGQLAGQQALLHGRNGYNPMSGVKYFNPNAFETNFSSFGYTGFGKAVSTIYGPSYKNMDISLTKNTKITERTNFKFSANFFNAFNNHYFVGAQSEDWGGSPVAFVTDVNATGNSFGTWNGNVSAPRTIQFAGRFEF